MGNSKIREIEAKIADLKARWPAHTVPSSMWRELEELESELDRAKGASPFDNFASEYDAWFDGEGRLIFDIEARALREVLPYLPRPWLEVGVGSGRFAQALGIEAGVDPALGLLDMARGRGLMVILGSGEREPLAAGSFGSAFIIVTLCFVASPLAVLKETHRILRPGGKVVLGLVLKQSPWGRLFESKKRQGHLFYRHATFYRYDGLVALLEQAGFAVEKVISTLFQKPGEVERMELPREGFSAEAGFVVVLAGRQG